MAYYLAGKKAASMDKTMAVWKVHEMVGQKAASKDNQLAVCWVDLKERD